jgi:hypothetical protein
MRNEGFQERRAAVFKTGALNHSATPPGLFISHLQILF